MTKQSRRLEREGEWYKIYSTPSHPRIYESKLASGEEHISLSEVLRRWEQWDVSERIEFARAFGCKNKLDGEDERVLEFLMGDDHLVVCTSIALLAATRASRPSAVRFLIRCINMFPDDCGNFLQALSVLAAPETMPTLLRIYQASEANVVNDPQGLEPVINLLYSSAALFKLLGHEKYRDTIVRFLQHSNEAVRTNALLCLQELDKGSQFRSIE